MSGRDAQRAKVYAAEALTRRVLDQSAEFRTIELAGSTLTLPAEIKFGDLAAVQKYVDHVLMQDWVVAAYPAARMLVRVRERAGDTQAHYEHATSTIAVPTAGDRWAMRELVVLHEIAHHLGGPEDLLHGGEFCARLIHLVSEMVGPEAALLLRINLLDAGAHIA
ncbi:MAG: TIGR04338 family metallohydrolase [Antricoccus sp.]